MPKLSQSLSKYDLGFLRIIAKFWGFDRPLIDKKSTIEQLSTWMTSPQNVQAILNNLSSDALTALEDLIAHQGRLPISVFTRKYGEIRQMGAGKRDRESIFLSPQNASESLSFQALIFRDFFEGEQGIEEFIYIPSDLLSVIPLTPSSKSSDLEGIPNSEQINPLCAVQDHLFDDACTCLAWLRMNKLKIQRLTELRNYLLISKENFPTLPLSLKSEFLIIILSEAGVVDSSGLPSPDPTRDFLSLPRSEAIKLLYKTWVRTSSINELKQLEQLECFGEWENDPKLARHFLTTQLKSLKSECWYELDLFINYIHDRFPDFQRPGGNYHVWLIRRRSNGKFLQGFENWHSIDGELLRYLILGPLLWFGVVELGLSKQRSSYAFRITQQGKGLLHDQPQTADEEIEKKFRVLPNGMISIPRRFLPPARYQVARFCQWKDYKNGHYIYQITPSSLHKAQQQNLKPSQLIRLLQKFSENLPQTVIQAIRRWIINSTEIKMQRLTILRVRSPKILDQITKSQGSKYLQQILNSTTAVVVSGQEKNLADTLLALGYLADIESLE